MEIDDYDFLVFTRDSYEDSIEVRVIDDYEKIFDLWNFVAADNDETTGIDWLPFELYQEKYAKPTRVV